MQTVYDPTASLSADRRGTLSLPDPESCFGVKATSKYAPKVRSPRQARGRSLLAFRSLLACRSFLAYGSLLACRSLVGWRCLLARVHVWPCAHSPPSPAPPQVRDGILKHIEEHPDGQWKHFLFANRSKVYGSPMFDQASVYDACLGKGYSQRSCRVACILSYARCAFASDVGGR